MNKLIWIGIGVVILVLVLLLVQYKNKVKTDKDDIKKSSSSENNALVNATKIKMESILSDLLRNSNNNPMTFDVIKDAAKSNGILVLRDTDTYTAEFNPNRVIIKEVAKQCIKAPCVNDFSIVSIG